MNDLVSTLRQIAGDTADGESVMANPKFLRTAADRIERALQQVDIADKYAGDCRIPGDGVPSVWELQNGLIREILNDH